MDVKSAVEAVLFAAGDSVPVARLSLVLGAAEQEVERALDCLCAEYETQERGMRILRLDDKVQMCSAPEYAGVIANCMEQRKPPMLSQAALETRAVVAYFQPVTRAYVEQVRGVDSSYSIGMLSERGLIEECGRLEVPGRPAVFRTTDVFLRTMGVSRLSELPPLPDMSAGDGQEKLQQAIERLSAEERQEQMSFGDLQEADSGEGIT